MLKPPGSWLHLAPAWSSHLVLVRCCANSYLNIDIHLILKHTYSASYQLGFPGGAVVKNLPANAGDLGQKIPWRRKSQPTPVLSPGKSHGQRSLEGYSPRGRKESDRTQQLNKNSNLPVSTEMLYLLLFKCDVMCIDDLILTPVAREARRDPGTAGRDQEMDGGPDFWIQDVDLEPEDRKELMQSIRILWVALCFHKEHSLAQQKILWKWPSYSCGPRSQSSWGKKTGLKQHSQLFLKQVPMMFRHFQVCTLHTET